MAGFLQKLSFGHGFRMPISETRSPAGLRGMTRAGANLLWLPRQYGFVPRLSCRATLTKWSDTRDRTYLRASFFGVFFIAGFECIDEGGNWWMGGGGLGL